MELLFSLTPRLSGGEAVRLEPNVRPMVAHKALTHNENSNALDETVGLARQGTVHDNADTEHEPSAGLRRPMLKPREPQAQ